LGVGLTTLSCKKRKLLRSLQEIQPDFEEEAKAYAGPWSQGKKKKKKLFYELHVQSRYSMCTIYSAW
jgi:hypothetical protein